MNDAAPAGDIRRERILMTGITGIHGWPLYTLLTSLLPPERLFGIGPPHMRTPSGKGTLGCCVSDRPALARIRDHFAPNLVIHAAGVCDLDVCEERPAWADRLNNEGTAAIAQVFGDTAAILFLSTDLVFSGDNAPPGGYTEAHTPDPVSIAGKTFLAAEKQLAGCPRCSIIRLGLPVGPSVTGDKGGLDWVESRFRKNRPVTLFTDEYRSVIDNRDAARCVVEFAVRRINGLFHLGGPTPISLHGLGKMIIEGGNYDPALLKGILRIDERNGPPRIGNVALCSKKILHYLSTPPGEWQYNAP
jgi:dTDP-4-dehydrorhamnose reductase